MSYLSISLNRLLSSPDKRAIDYCCVRPCAADSLQPPSFFFFVVVAVSYAPRPEGQQLSKRDLGKHTQKKKKKGHRISALPRSSGIPKYLSTLLAHIIRSTRNTRRAGKKQQGILFPPTREGSPCSCNGDQQRICAVSFSR